MSWDLDAFNRLKETAPKRYRNTKSILRVNGPLAVLLMGFAMVGTLVNFEPKEFPVWKLLVFEITYLLLLIVSVRWFIWSLKKG